jgi:hypothetical protein
MADRTRVVSNENHIKIEVDNLRIENKATWYQERLGGPLASVVASVVAEAWDKPVTINREEHQKGKYSIELEVVG